MHKLIGSLVLALVLAAPGLAQPQKVYVPVLDSVAGLADTEIRVANEAPTEQAYTTAFLAADTDGTARRPERGVARVLGAGQKVGFTAHASGLFELAADQDVAVAAWLKGLDLAGEPFFARLPVITPARRFEVEEVAFLDRLPGARRAAVTDLAIVNLGQEGGLCKVDILGRQGETLDSSTVDVPALALRQLAGAQGFAAKAGAAALAVSCDQPYYPFAVVANAKSGIVSTVLPAERESCKGIDVDRDPEIPGRLIYRKDGEFFVSSDAKPKGVLCVKVEQELRVAKLIWELDVTVGPWNSKLRSGAHSVNWFHRGRFRSDTIANVNLFGPGKNVVKANQNIDLPRGNVTKVQGGFAAETGQTYHFRYTYDANAKTINMVVIQGANILKNLTFQGTGSRNLVIPANGLTAEFGHNKGQHVPEVAHKGWKFANFRVEMILNPN